MAAAVSLPPPSARGARTGRNRRLRRNGVGRRAFGGRVSASELVAAAGGDFMAAFQALVSPGEEAGPSAYAMRKHAEALAASDPKAYLRDALAAGDVEAALWLLRRLPSGCVRRPYTIIGQETAGTDCGRFEERIELMHFRRFDDRAHIGRGRSNDLRRAVSGAPLLQPGQRVRQRSRTLRAHCRALQHLMARRGRAARYSGAGEGRYPCRHRPHSGRERRFRGRDRHDLQPQGLQFRLRRTGRRFSGTGEGCCA